MVSRAGGVVVAVLIMAAATTGEANGLPVAGAGTTGAPQCTPARRAKPGAVQQTLQYGGVDRRYELTIPKRYDGRRQAPLVINLHGFTGTGRAQNGDTDMPAVAGKRGYVVVAPDGGPLKVPLNIVPGAESAGQFEGRPFWNIFAPGVVDFGPPRGQNLGLDSSAVGADDVAFVAQLLDALSGTLCLDAKRVYVTGMSNGAGMATTLGCNLGDRIAAIAPVSGVNLTGTCPGDTPVSVLAVHGDADDTVLYDGNGLLGYQFGNPSVPERMAQWAERDGCDAMRATKHPRKGLTVARWRGCTGGTDVELWTIAGWGHEWPRARSAEDPGMIDATRVALDFFDAHARRRS
jgi:polyhydroxybutyrate depolymerase